MKRLLISSLLMLFAFSAMADEDYNTRFTTALQDSFPLAKEILAEWDQKGPKDGDYYAAHFNIHQNQALDRIINVTKYVPLYLQEGQYMVMQDSLGNEAGYMYNGITVGNKEQLDSAITWIKKGIETFPQRLDLRLGYSTLYRMLDDAENMYLKMEQTVNWILQNPDVTYTWTSDAVVDKKEIIDNVMQDYFGNCYYSSEYKSYAEKFADLGVRFSPNNAIFWNDKAVVRLEANDLQGALELMEKALTMNPDDELIKNNIKYIKETIEEEKKKGK
ncbi:MAG: hypothetical protein Q4E26_02725 [Prevotellaceae bacterium]|nr:hypothetical protein [Prevotellaceae bacterium]